MAESEEDSEMESVCFNQYLLALPSSEDGPTLVIIVSQAASDSGFFNQISNSSLFQNISPLKLSDPVPVKHDVCLAVVAGEELGSTSNRNLVAFSLKTSKECNTSEEDIVNLLSEFCPKAMMVTEDSESRSGKLATICLKCGQLCFSKGNISAEDIVSKHFTLFHPSEVSNISQTSVKKLNGHDCFIYFGAENVQYASSWQKLSVVLPSEVSTKSSHVQPVDSKTNQGEPVEETSTSGTSSTKLLQAPSPVFTRNHPHQQPLTPTNGPLSGTRCGSKTLKCPRCNWHYKVGYYFSI